MDKISKKGDGIDSHSTHHHEVNNQKIVEDRQTLLSVLLELTVASLNLFDPNTSMSSFLERIAERLGCAVVICIECAFEEKREFRLIDSVGLSRLSRQTPLSNFLCEKESQRKIGSAPPISLPYKELKRSQLKQWNFAIPIEGTGKDPGTLYYLQLYFEAKEEPQKQYHGIVERLLTTLRHALEHRRLYLKALEQKTLLEVQSECTMEGILIISSEKKVRFFNQRFVEMWGFQPELNRKLKKSMIEHFHSKVNDPPISFFDLSKNDQSAKSRIQCQLNLYDGQVFDCFSLPITSQDGTNYGRGWYFKDITEIKMGERELAKALGIRDDFISIASHELKTPITSLRLQLQLIHTELEKQHSGMLSAEAFCHHIQKKLAISEQQVERLIVLVFGLLDVSKIQAGTLSMEAKEVNLSNLLQESVHHFSDQFKAAGNEVILHIEPNITGYWDPVRIEQVINNLIVNAIKFGNSKPIEISLKKIQDHTFLTVKDHGRGIKKEHQKRIFEKYERVPSSHNVTGLGLGLYIAHQIVTHHRGTIWVDSSPGHGATFTVCLPIRATDSLKKSA
jgi:signal transduction histidine kinase